MVRIVFGRGLERAGSSIEVPARTLGEASRAIAEATEGFDPDDHRFFVGGVDSRRLEGHKTPVGDEDTVLVTLAASADR